MAAPTVARLGPAHPPFPHPCAAWPPDERALGRELDRQSRGGLLMKLTAPHESPRYVGGLQRGPLSG